MLVRLFLCLVMVCATPAFGQAAPPPPFEAPLLRLSEILGALNHLRSLCGAPDAKAWRQRMQALMDGEGADPATRGRLAGAFNRGYRTFNLTYHQCNDQARRTIETYLTEAGRISRELGSRYAN